MVEGLDRQAELNEFNPAILAKPTLLVGSKLDAMDDETRLKKLQSVAVEHGLEFHSISAATGAGIQDLKYKIADMLVVATGMDSGEVSAAHRSAPGDRG